jgi:hypothetical protein
MGMSCCCQLAQERKQNLGLRPAGANGAMSQGTMASHRVGLEAPYFSAGRKAPLDYHLSA